MSLLHNFQLMSRYNQWMNQNIFEAAQKLGNNFCRQDQGAFFGSILGTLNHIWVADVIWLTRFAQYVQEYRSLGNLPVLSSYTALDQIVVDDLAALKKLRQELDNTIIQWCQEIKIQDLEQNLQYIDTKGNQYTKNFAQLIQHFFNHQTHHRGQISTLIYQQGVDVGVTDLLKIISD